MRSTMPELLCMRYVHELSLYVAWSLLLQWTIVPWHILLRQRWRRRTAAATDVLSPRPQVLRNMCTSGGRRITVRRPLRSSSRSVPVIGPAVTERLWRPVRSAGSVKLRGHGVCIAGAA
jgi:hypothetical protein